MSEDDNVIPLRREDGGAPVIPADNFPNFLRALATQIENNDMGDVTGGAVVVHVNEGEGFRTKMRRHGASYAEVLGLLELMCHDMKNA